jgi:hypothetical protein
MSNDKICILVQAGVLTDRCQIGVAVETFSVHAKHNWKFMKLREIFQIFVDACLFYSSL